MSKKDHLSAIQHVLRHSAFQKVRIVIYFLPAIVFFSVFLLLFSVTQSVKKETKKYALPPRLFTDFRPVPYPQFSLSRDEKEKIATEISAQGAIIMDSDSKVVLFEKNTTTPFIMASSTKIMSALVALEYYRPDAVLTVLSTNVPPAIVGYSQGEKVRFLDMLYGMMLPSGNDAALAIAQNYPEGESGFIRAMNRKAKELSLFQTNFTDSSGLDSGNYTTVGELAVLASEAIKNPIFATVVHTKNKKTVNHANTKIYEVRNINELLGKYGVNGIKTGFTPDAGEILVTSTVQNGHTLIIVVMKSEDRFGDTEKILQTLSGNITYLSMLP